YALKVTGIEGGPSLYEEGFDTMFGEYRTTTPAIQGISRVFPRSVRIPMPRHPVRVAIEARDRSNILRPLFSVTVDPADYHLRREAGGDEEVFAVQTSGSPHDCVDLVFVGEGYTAADRDKFRADLERFRQALFAIEPYRSRQDRFNVVGVLPLSAETAMDEPRQRAWRRTALDASFNAFDLDRYMLIEGGHHLRAVAARVPYDTLVVLVNSARYGGGGIYNDYCVTTVDHPRSLAVFLHEFGHSFGGLADEYYTSDVSYNEFYPKGIEPLEPNITALLDPTRVKWADLLTPGLAVPTLYGKEEIEALQVEKAGLPELMKAEREKARRAGARDSQLQKMERIWDRKAAAFDRKIEAVRTSYASLLDKVGVFEGAGYAAKGLYRPMIHCLMISSPRNEYCRVCQRAIAERIDQLAPR
ncbi:MAG TPA: M64 family metallopeptidase, partial [Candidatus Aminicenantes bacterium]|nr:M64 family metallopeptidase [Candidatus Aminicenantes bacterium]